MNKKPDSGDAIVVADVVVIVVRDDVVDVATITFAFVVAFTTYVVCS
jgi:hypothetical protein